MTTRKEPPKPRRKPSKAAGSGATGKRRKPRSDAQNTGKATPDASVVPIRRGRAATRGRKLAPGRGRLTALTPEVQQRIVDVVRAGNYLDVAATYVGINRTTLFNWLARGRNELARVEGLWLAAAEKANVPLEAVEPPPFDPIERVFVDFFDAVQAADSEAEIRDIGYLETHKDWRARAWVRERRSRARWGSHETLAIEGGETPVRVELSEGERRDREREILEVLIDVGAVTYELEDE